MVKNPPANAGDISNVSSIQGLEDPLVEGMTAHLSLFLPGESHGQRSLEGCISWSQKRLGHDFANSICTALGILPNFLSFNFPICKMGITTVITSFGNCEG